jgi:hypothetical protein
MHSSSAPTTGRRVGYIIAIIFLVLFMVFINNLRNWNLPFVNSYVTPAFSSWLWAGNLSLSVAIFCNVLFLAYDPRWFRRLMEVIQNGFSLFSTFIIAMALTGLAILVNTVQAIIGMFREPASP